MLLLNAIGFVGEGKKQGLKTTGQCAWSFDGWENSFNLIADA
jgi:hypothetical protein